MPGATLDVYGPRQADGPLGDVFAQMMRPPFFPIRPTDLIGEVRFHDTADDDFPVGLAKVRSRWVRHVGPTLGFRVEWNGTSIAYLPDHGPGTVVEHADDYVPPEVLELCDGVDVLIHDAQHTLDEYEPKRHWGHCTVDYAVLVAREAGARSLVLFHHDPLHGDDEMDRIGERGAASSRRAWACPSSSSPATVCSCTSRRTRRAVAPRARDEPVRHRVRSLPTPRPTARCSVTSRPAWCS